VAQSTLNRDAAFRVDSIPTGRLSHDGSTFGYEALLRNDEPILKHPSALLESEVGRVRLGADSTCVPIIGSRIRQHRRDRNRAA
jgi:hypothetical protein